MQWYTCTHTYRIDFQPHKDQICIEIIYVTSSKLRFKQARWKCPADLLPIRKTYLQLVVNGLLSFPFFPFLIISLLSLYKNFSATLKRLQVLFIFTFFSPNFTSSQKASGIFLGFLFFFFHYYYSILKWLIYSSPSLWVKLTLYCISSDSPSFESLGTGSRGLGSKVLLSWHYLLSTKTVMACAVTV